MEVIVIGCGRVGSELAYRVYKKGHHVTVIDSNEASFRNLPADFRGRTVEGEALNQIVLRRAGIETADGLAAVTNSDTLNVAVAHVARTVYKVPNVVARNYDASLRGLHEAFGLQVVSSTSWGAQRVEEMLYHQEMRSVFSAGNGEVEIYEFTVPPAWDGLSLGEILPENHCVPAALTRAGQAIMPGKDTVLNIGDIVLVSATFDGIESLRQRFKAAQEVL
jgi:trk system potassium uptake protein TrkA